jgi:hypothetical protein
MVKIACLPRPPLGYGWMTPALACVEMMQCLAQVSSSSSSGSSWHWAVAVAMVPYMTSFPCFMSANPGNGGRPPLVMGSLPQGDKNMQDQVSLVVLWQPADTAGCPFRPQ